MESKMVVEEDMGLLLAFEGLSTAPGVLGRPALQPHPVGIFAPAPSC